MTNTTPPQKSRPSPWALGFFIASTGFALAAVWLVSTGYNPL